MAKEKGQWNYRTVKKDTVDDLNLKEMGEGGWECVGVVNEGKKVVAVFKRPAGKYVGDLLEDLVESLKAQKQT